MEPEVQSQTESQEERGSIYIMPSSQSRPVTPFPLLDTRFS